MQSGPASNIILLVIALLGCILFYQLQSRRSSLSADVRGIAGLASMAVVSHMLMDFRTWMSRRTRISSSPQRPPLRPAQLSTGTRRRRKSGVEAGAGQVQQMDHLSANAHP